MTQTLGFFFAVCAILGVAGLGICFASETRGGKALGVSGEVAMAFVAVDMLVALLVFLYVTAVPA
jgi:hypothetical protein